MKAPIPKMLLMLTAVLASIYTAEVSVPKCKFNAYYCQTCEKLRQCPTDRNLDIVLVCPENHHCYLMGRFVCASRGCWETDDARWEFDCPGQGRYADRTDCTNSFTCVRHHNGSYLKVSDGCPEGLQFDAREGTCTIPEVAKCHRGLLYLSEDMELAESDGYKCEGVGVFPDPNSREHFHICEMDDYIIKERKMKCPKGKTFNFLQSGCE